MPLRDPLAGRRTVLVEGVDDTAELVIPDPAMASTAGAARTSAHAGRGYRGHLDAIGPEGFHEPILRAAAAFVAANWPSPDLAALKSDLRARVLAADPGGRTAAEITDRASDRHLDGAIAWVVGQERRKREAQAAQAAAAEAVPPTFLARGVPLDVAKAQAQAAVGAFATRVAAGECPTLLLRMTVGAGKSEAAIKNADALLNAAHAGGRNGALIYLLPRHDLSAELRERMCKAHPGKKVAVLKGIDWKNRDDPDDVMCLDPELPKAATAASQPASSVWRGSSQGNT